MCVVVVTACRGESSMEHCTYSARQSYSLTDLLSNNIILNTPPMDRQTSRCQSVAMHVSDRKLLTLTNLLSFGEY